MPIKRRPPQALVLKEFHMRLPSWLVPVTLLVAAFGAGWKWEHFPL